MAPHPEGEAKDFAAAKWEFDIATRGLTGDELDESARAWIATVRRIFDTGSVKDLTGRGHLTVRAEQLTLEERTTVAEAIDDLASWFGRVASGVTSSRRRAPTGADVS
jgi:hypothetical protein